LNVGGPSKQILTLNSLFDGREFEQLIVTGSVLDSEVEIDLNSLGGVVRINSLQRRFNPLNDFRSILKIAKVLRQYKPDILHTHLTKAWALTILAKSLSGVNCRVIHTFHGHTLHSYFSKWKTSILRSVQRYLAYKSDCLVAVNEITKMDLITAKIGSQGKFSVIHPGFKTLNQYSKTNARRRLGLTEDAFTVGFVGRFEAIKRPDILSKVINISLGASGSIQFLICGGGALYDEFKRATANARVHCLPWIDDLSHIYSSVDLMILTSDNEGSPLTIIEAGQLGVPTLSRSVGGVPSLIVHGKTGYLGGDQPEMLAKSLSEIFANTKLLLEVSSQARVHFEKEYGEKVFLKKHRDLYSSL
jgi:glycosyltransferase involved in cell wall biosynthesis